MKNLFTLLCCLFFTAFTVNAQTVLLDDDFEALNFPQSPNSQNYTLYDIDGNTIDPGSGLQGAFNGKAWTDNVIFTNSSNRFISSISIYKPAGTADDWVITPKLSLTASTDNWMFYSVRTGGSASGETYEILISTTTTNVDSFSVLYSETNTPTSWTSERIDLSSYAGQDVYLAIRNTTFDGSIIAIDDLVVSSDLPFAEAELQMVDVPGKVTAGTTTNIEATVGYSGIDSLGSVDLNWSVDGGTVHTKSVSGLNLSFGSSTIITHDDKWTPATADIGKTMELKVWTSNPNGQTDENPSNDTLVKEILIGNGNTVQRNILFEEFTTTSCGYCPQGHDFAEDMLAADPNLIAVSVHSCFNTDVMTNNHSTDLCNEIGANAAPMGMIDRILYDGEDDPAFSRSKWKSRATARKSVGSAADIIFRGSYDSTNRKLNFDVKTTFVDYVASGDIRLAVMVIEDHVSGGSAYDQANYFNDGRGNPIPGYVHRHVLRDIKPSTWGDATVIPSTPAINTEYKKSFNFTLNSAWDEEEVSIVAVVSYKGTSDDGYEVINARQANLFNLNTSVNNLTENVQHLNIFPNPTAEKTNVELSLKENANVAISLRDITGKVVFEESYGTMVKGTHKLPIDVSSFSNGFYFVNIKVGDNQLSRKIIVNK